MEKPYDLLVIGAGPGGYVAAIRAAKAGLKTAIIEKDRSGGTCLNRGCIPTKAMIHAGETYRGAKEAGRFGVSAGTVSFDYGQICRYRQETVDALVGGVDQLLAGNGVEVIRGTGQLQSPEGDRNIVTVNQEEEQVLRLESKNVILATGSVPAVLPIPGADLPGVVTSDGLFALEHAPESLLIIGGGVIGMEFASVYSDLGIPVTVVEALPRILDNFDKEISRNLQMILKKRGVTIHTGAKVGEIRPAADGTGLTVAFEVKEKPLEASAQYVLMAAGRRPFLEGVVAEGVDLEMNGRFVAVDENLQTNIPGVYAIGDITGGMQLAHQASAQGTFVAEYLAKEAPDQDLDLIPACVYTDPEIASVGLTEDRAKEEGREIVAGKFIMSANGRSLISGEERGFVKVIASPDNGEILGAQMMCARATDMIGEFTTALANRLTAKDMLRGIRAHPTYNEGIAEALEDLVGESTHTMPRRRR